MPKIRSTTQYQRESTWDVARLFPGQDHWSEEEYLALDTNHLVEFSRGALEVPPMPTTSHQKIVAVLLELLRRFVTPHNLGLALPAPLPVQLWPGKYREPDIVFMLARNLARCNEQFWLGADLVMEVVSPDEPSRDWVTKRREYAEAAIPEYWIVDPGTQTVTVLHLEGESYQPFGEYSSGAQAASALLPGFTVAVDEIFAAAA